MTPSPAELARKIETGIETKSGRYDWASKVEVRAFVRKEIGGLDRELRVDITRREVALRKEMAALRVLIAGMELSIAELELSWWQRVKRAIGVPS